MACQALPAGAAGHPRFDGNPLSHLQRGDLGAHGRHDAAGLVAQDQRRVHHIWTDPAVLEVVHVGAAHSHRPDLDQHLVGGGLGDAALFHGDLSHAAQHAHLHRRHVNDLPRALK